MITATFSPSTSSPPSPARVVEVGGVTAGIAVPEDGRLRFFSAQRPFDGLDQRIYSSLGQVNAAARACLRRSEQRQRSRPREAAAPVGCVETCPHGRWSHPGAPANPSA